MRATVRGPWGKMKVVAWAGVCLACAATVQANQDVYQKTVRSTVLILSQRAENAMSVGTGVMVNRQQGIIVTAAHVVGDNAKVMVVFPEYNGDRAITDTKFYMENIGRLKIEGEVLKADTRRDVAVIKLPSVANSATAMPLATDSARAGQTLFVVGNSSIDLGGLFGYTEGPVRNVYQRPDGVRIVDTAIPTNKGDSGGPVVNDKGELMAIVSSGTTGQQAQQLRDFSIDVNEIRDLLTSLQISNDAATTVVANNPFDFSRPNPFSLLPPPAPAPSPFTPAPFNPSPSVLNPEPTVIPPAPAPVTPAPINNLPDWLVSRPSSPTPAPPAPSPFDNSNGPSPFPWSNPPRFALRSLTGGTWEFTESCDEHGSHSLVHDFRPNNVLVVTKYTRGGEVLGRYTGQYSVVGNTLTIKMGDKVVLEGTITWTNDNKFVLAVAGGDAITWTRDALTAPPATPVARR